MKGIDSGVHSRLYPEVVMEALLQIGQVARKTGLSIDAIRFYEKEGLLPRPSRTRSGYRVYKEREVADLEFIQRAQQLGFSLNEIRELFTIQRQPREVCGHVRHLIAEKLSAVRGKITELQRMETDLADALRQCNKALQRSAKHSDSCPVLEEIAAPSRRGGRHES